MEFAVWPPAAASLTREQRQGCNHDPGSDAPARVCVGVSARRWHVVVRPEATDAARPERPGQDHPGLRKVRLNFVTAASLMLLGPGQAYLRLLLTSKVAATSNGYSQSRRIRGTPKPPMRMLSLIWGDPFRGGSANPMHQPVVQRVGDRVPTMHPVLACDCAPIRL